MTQLHAAPCKPHATLFSLGLFGGRLGLCGLVFWGSLGFLVGRGFFAFYFLPMKRSSGNGEKQVKEKEMVLNLCILLSLVYRLFLQGLVLTAAETTHISVDFTYFQKARLKGGRLAPQDLACLTDTCFTACGLKRRKRVTAKVYLWLAACSYQECRSTPAPEFGSASPPGKQFTFSLKEREEREKIAGVFLFYETPEGFFFPARIGWLLLRQRAGWPQ